MDEVQIIEGLYYPGVAFPSVGWVKSSLLYWEGLLRVVPDGQTPQDPPEVKELVDAGLVQNLSPAPFRRATADTFGPRLQDLLLSRDGKPVEGEWYDAPAKPKDEVIHRTTIEADLADELRSKHLLSIEGEWVRLSSAMARLYQTTLANEAANQLFAAPVTEDCGDDVASTYFSTGKMACNRASAPTDGLQWAQLYLPFPSPEMAERLSVKQVIDIRERLAPLRRGFREQVQRRTAALASLPSPEAIRMQLDEFAKEMNEELEQEREALRKQRIRDFWKIVAVSAPLSLGAGSSLIGAPVLAARAGVFGSVGLGLVDWFFEGKARPRAQGHYLLNLDLEVDRKQVVNDLEERMRRLTKGS
jgi:hypothetical protein